jgi:mRNA interferase RelE/StbE
MAFAIEFERAAARELDDLGHEAASRILRFLHQRVASLDDPRAIG